jgi:translation initiation factor IF-3
VNEAIRVPRVRLIDVEGEQVGLKTRDEALEYAWSKNLDLVEVAPDANPPVCRVMDYSKYKYEQEQKQKLARKHQSTITIKEIKLRPKIDPHDYETKKGHVLRFLKGRDKVKVTIMFRGREMYHPERGRSLLLRLADDVKDLAVIESDPLQDGRNMVMMLAPHKDAGAEERPPTTEKPDKTEKTEKKERAPAPEGVAAEATPEDADPAPVAEEAIDEAETPAPEVADPAPAPTAEEATSEAETPAPEAAEAAPEAPAPKPRAPRAKARASAETPATPT